MTETDPRWWAAAPERVRAQWALAAMWLLMVPIALVWIPSPLYALVAAAIGGFHVHLSRRYRRQALREASRRVPPSA